MNVKIDIRHISAIHDLKEEGTLFELGCDADEWVKVSFEDSLKAYCEAMDDGTGIILLDEKTYDVS